MDLPLLVDLFFHLEQHISYVLQAFGVWTYLIVFLIVFCETGLVVTPILPGDSLLFGLGTFAARGDLDVTWLLVSLGIAAIAGDTANYAIGHYIGPKVFNREKSLFFRKEYLDRTHRFYEKYGGMTIILARFVPIVRTFAPFVAGIGSMTYPRFLSFNVIGGLAWIFLFIMGGYFFGNLSFVKANFTFVIIAIIFISILPGVIEYLRHRRDGDTGKGR